VSLIDAILALNDLVLPSNMARLSTDMFRIILDDPVDWDDSFSIDAKRYRIFSINSLKRSISIGLTQGKGLNEEWFKVAGNATDYPCIRCFRLKITG
jgi:hypothetical protein